MDTVLMNKIAKNKIFTIENLHKNIILEAWVDVTQPLRKIILEIHFFKKHLRISLNQDDV